MMESNNEFTHDEIVRHISAFLSAKSAPAAASAADIDNTDVDNNDDDGPTPTEGSNQNQRKESLDSISYLVKFLEVNEKATAATIDIASDVTITKEDVAALVLPWSVARLMRSASSNDDDGAPPDESSEADEAAWKALARCLDVLSAAEGSEAAAATTEANDDATAAAADPTSHEALLSSSLDHGALNRLMPRAAKASFASSSSTTADVRVRVHASDCFVRLAKRFKPSLDGTLLHLDHRHGL